MTNSHQLAMLTNHGRVVRVLSQPRQISGGSVTLVAWHEDNFSSRLPDGSVHPAQRAGFSWEEPTANLVYLT